jgi:FKBP-type peptidyl-prolyl cis-trans isomerase
MKKLVLSIAVITIALFLSCSNDSDIKILDSGLKYFDETVGEGRDAKVGDLVSINFKGWVVMDSTNLFTDWTKDSTRAPYLIGDSYIQGQIIKFVLGEDAFIRGSDEGIIGMKPKGKRMIFIPSNLAYGEAGVGPVPPNADLKVVVELIDVKDPVVAEKWDVDKSKIKTTESGLMYAIVEEGEGEFVTEGNVVTVNYTGYLEDGTKFDSSVERDEPFSFVVGNKQVIPGWDEGIRLLKKGGKARFIIPPSLGYGDIAVGKIPAGSTITFDVELLDVK